MKKISITKYNPTFRNASGHYQKEEWTSISDIGRIYENQVFTYDEYIKTENLYIESILLILNFFDNSGIIIDHMFYYANKNALEKYFCGELYESLLKFKQKQVVNNKIKIEELVKLRLRECIAELELNIDKYPKNKILFGFDYYMYIETDRDISYLIPKIEKLGLYIY